jgi:short-subunit dehydrogenase
MLTDSSERSFDVRVNNARYGLLGAVEEASALKVESVFTTNVFGLLSVARAILQYMRKRRSGHIINMSSIGGYAFPGWGISCATKFAVEGISEALSIELARSACTPPSSSPSISVRIFSAPPH